LSGDLARAHPTILSPPLQLPTTDYGATQIFIGEFFAIALVKPARNRSQVTDISLNGLWGSILFLEIRSKFIQGRGLNRYGLHMRIIAK